ncbi:MAG: response regulator [Deltaproteobacteria bacterium]|jgi:DNA-binding NtrC family response regulator
MAKRSIVVVDDDRAVLDIISAFLSRAGYEVFTANGISSCLDLFREHGDEIDLAMIDVRMGRESGFDLADILEQDFKFYDQVFMTAFFWEEKTLENLLERGKPYFEKPLRLEAEVLPFLEEYFGKEKTIS